MIGTESHVTRSSNRSSSTKNWTRSMTRSRHGRVPEYCGCGCRPVLRWSAIETHPNKFFFGCPNYNMSEEGYLQTSEKKWCDLFVWADCVQEELTKKVVLGDDDGEIKMNFARRFGKMDANFEI
ncbi:hypothetical protein Ahy_B01g056443 [Arachis hypogaea]|uniref:Zinc finger GRF-type domain-containing protein n=1 Tax=Arachis hypogaea TaxID=3818 RepID=A0A445AYX5_ARAHY|nr:hypothetical protein Ahy_B01g056443 [Arachis hypogaea]